MAVLDSLLDYQKQAVKCALDGLHDVASRDMIVIPTGGGKTWVLAAIAELAHSHQVLVATPRKRLLEQTFKHISGFCKALPGVLSAGMGEDSGEKHRVLIGTVQTLINRTFLEPELILIDECHLMPPDTRYGELLRRFPQAKVIGLTATPVRGRDPLGDLGWTNIFEIGIVELVKTGRLVLPRSVATKGSTISSDADNEDVTREIIPNLIAQVEKEQCKKILVFGADIQHATFVADRLREAGEELVWDIHSNQRFDKQSRSIHGFQEAKKRAWLINVGLIGVGVDIPSIDAVVLLRDVRSFSWLVQAIGRGLRKSSGKKECLVFDFGFGTQRFGFIDRPKLSPNGELKNAIGKCTKPCPLCGTLSYLKVRECHHCGYEFSFRVNIKPSAVSVELLSDSMIVATITKSAISEVPAGAGTAWRVEYHFAEDNKIRTVEYTQTKPNLYDVGQSVLVRTNGRFLAKILRRCEGGS